MRDYYFRYHNRHTGEFIDREDAVELLRDRKLGDMGLVVHIHPGAQPIQVRVSVSGFMGMVTHPTVEIAGWGFQEPTIAHRVGLALVEAAALADEAVKPVQGELT